MSCNGCRVLRKGCSEDCPLRPCLSWIPGGDAQGHATVFLAKFFGRASLLGLVQGVPESQRPNLFQSLLYEACGRTISPVYGAVGLLWSGHWSLCQQAVDHVLKTGSPAASGAAAAAASKAQQNPSLPSFAHHTATQQQQQRSSSPILVPSTKPTSSSRAPRSTSPDESGVDNPPAPLSSYYPPATSVSPPAWQSGGGGDMWNGGTGTVLPPAQGVPLSGGPPPPVGYWPMGMSFHPGIANGYPAAASAQGNVGQGYSNPHGWGTTAATGGGVVGGYSQQTPTPEAYLMAAAAFQSYSGAMLGAAMDLDSLRMMYSPYGGGVPGAAMGLGAGTQGSGTGTCSNNNGVSMCHPNNNMACDMEGVEAMEGMVPSSLGCKPSSHSDQQQKTGGQRETMPASKTSNTGNPPLVAPVARRLQPMSNRNSFVPVSVSPTPGAMGATSGYHKGNGMQSHYNHQDRDDDSSCESGDFVAVWAQPHLVQDGGSHRPLLPLLH